MHSLGEAIYRVLCAHRRTAINPRQARASNKAVVCVCGWQMPYAERGEGQDLFIRHQVAAIHAELEGR